MSRNKLKLAVDILMFLVFLIIAFSGFVLWLILPSGGGRLAGSFVFLREEWLFIHNWFSVLLIFLVLVHLFLNWIWIKNMFKVFFKKTKTFLSFFYYCFLRREKCIKSFLLFSHLLYLWL